MDQCDVCNRARFSSNNSFCHKIIFLNLLENLVITFSLKLVYTESLHYFLYSRINPLFRENMVPKIGAEMLSPNQITWCLNQR